MSFDLLIRGGTIVDGTGAPSFRGDVAVAGGRIAEIGSKVTGSAKRTIDAGGLVVAPGFIDPHTHYDAQICWDRDITPSAWHGITTVMMGNCGVGIAPCKPETREIASWDLVNVEAIPFDALSRAITWDWVTFPEFMAAAGERHPALNLGFLAPLTPFRHFVMGDQSMERAATAAETRDIAALFRGAIEAGAFGFTTTLLTQHIGYHGRPLASRLASREELGAYANVLRDLGRGVIEIALTQSPGRLAEDEQALLEFLLDESRANVTWLALLGRDDDPQACLESLRRADPLIRRGGIPQVTCMPLMVQLDLKFPFIFADTPAWKPAFNKTVPDQKALYASEKFRSDARTALEQPRIFSGRWERMKVKEVASPALASLVGKTVEKIAAERGKTGLDTLFDLAIEDDLEMQFSCALFNGDERRIPELITDPRTMIGLSDGGAHVDMLCDAGYATHFLGHWVRDEQVMTLERAVERLTTEPARFFGIRDRGKLAEGMAADVVAFDLGNVGWQADPEMQNDLPGGGRRLVVRSRGIELTVVNGEVVYDRGSRTDAYPGMVLRSGAQP